MIDDKVKSNHAKITQFMESLHSFLQSSEEMADVVDHLPEGFSIGLLINSLLLASSTSSKLALAATFRRGYLSGEADNRQDRIEASIG